MNKELRIEKRGLSGRRGTTLIELFIVLGVIGILAGVVLPTLLGRRRVGELNSTVAQIESLLREAQSRAVSQDNGSAWGVHFANSTTTTPFYELFYSSYSTGTVVRRATLPSSVVFGTSTVPTGVAIEVYFSQLNGARTGSSTINVYLATDTSVSSTINISSTGVVSK